MKIRRIVPEEIGKFGKGSSALDLPDEPFVVVYGNNEAGKSTFSDMAVTLLSSKYDRTILDRYRPDAVSDPALRGKVVLEEEGSILTVSFTARAKFPKRESDVLRAFDPHDSVAANVLRNLPDGIVRNLFRLDSVELAGGVSAESEPVKRFIEYSKGNKAGSQVTDLLKAWLSEAESAAKDASKFSVERDQLRISLDGAKQTSDMLSRVEREIADVEKKRLSLRTELHEFDQERELIIFSRGLRPLHKDFLEAQRKLADLEDAGDILPETVDGITPYLQDRCGLLEENGLESVSKQILDDSEDLERLDKQIEESCRRLRVQRQEFSENQSYVTEESTNSVTDSVKEIGRKFRSLITNLNKESQDLIDTRAQLDLFKFQESQLSSEWEKWRGDCTPQRYLSDATVRSNTVGGVIPVRMRLNFLPALITLAATAVAIAFGQIVVAAVTFASAIFTLGLARIQSRQGTGDSRGESSSEIDLSELAHSIVNHDKKIVDQEQSVFRLDREVKDLQDIAIPGAREESRRLSEEINAEIPLDADENTLKKWCDDISELARLVRKHRGLATKIRDSQLLEESLEKQFHDLRGEVVGALAQVGVQTSIDVFPRPSHLLKTLSSVVARSQTQKELRRQVKKYERVRAENHPDDERVEAFLDANVEALRIPELNAATRSLRQELNDADQAMFGLEQEVTVLRGKKQIQELNSEIESIDRSIRELRIKRARLLVQAQVVEDLAKKISGLTLPRLVDRLNEIVRSAAPTWKKVDISEAGLVRIEQDRGVVTGENLSRGACALLGTAMRLVIMQVEAEESGLRLPLLCDDPLVHLDLQRLKDLLAFVNDHCEGHQIVYFTCKHEVKEIAGQLGIPVVEVR